MTSVKKLGSRLSSILPSRARSAASVSVGKAKAIGVVDEKKAGTPCITSVEEEPTTNTDYNSSINGRTLLTTFESSGMELKYSDVDGADHDATLMVRKSSTKYQMLTTDRSGRTIQ